MTAGQDLFDLSTRTLAGMKAVLAAERPDVVLVQGDTTSAFLAALGAFYCRIPVGHVEAGLRTGDRYDPFPEEMNRTMLSSVAVHHFAPTERARANLLAAGVAPSTIHVTGNTVVDAVRTVAGWPEPPPVPELARLDPSRHRLIVLTTHRRESFGKPMRDVLSAMADVVARAPEAFVVFPVHMNPNVRAAVADTLGVHDRVALLDPMPYHEFVHLLRRAHLLVTDSGGIQEEAAALGKPVVVVRDTTERGEAVDAGVSILVGRERGRVAAEILRLLRDDDAWQTMARAKCPYGDGRAAEHIVDVLVGAHAPRLAEPRRRGARRAPRRDTVPGTVAAAAGQKPNRGGIRGTGD
jgi:UDP-N-acetylglucosamine 2-epimerase (non-hydrolysing)